jgi:hypothetical protein
MVALPQSTAANRSFARTAAILLAAALLVAASGCVRRRLTVRTNPPGAQVFVDDQEIGTSPCSASFVYYGTRKITVMKDGYRTETLWQTLNPPWYQLPVAEFISENLVAREIRDERIVDVQLLPQEIVPPERLLDRAQSLRDSAQTGAVTPLLNLPPDGATPPREGAGKLGFPGDGLPGGDPFP